MRHVLTLFDLSTRELERIFALAEDLKSKYVAGVREPLLPGRVIGMLFEKPSLRTRLSFESGMTHLGGGSLFLGEDVGWQNGRESIEDFSQVLSEMLDVVVCRAKSHSTVESLAKSCSIPVINGLTDISHPCQALADLFTVKERHGGLAGCRVAYIGDANNVARSLAVACGKMGLGFSIASPKGYEFEDAFVQQLKQECPELEMLQTDDPREAVKDCSAIYTDVWASMGQESEREIRLKAFAEYQVDDRLMREAPSEAIFLHCLPARRGEEVTDSVIDGPQSAVFQQAGNRVHAQKGLLAWLMASQ